MIRLDDNIEDPDLIEPRTAIRDVPLETRIMLVALLRRTLADLHTNKAREIYQEAEAWVEARGIYGRYEYWLSFKNVCLNLGMNPDRVRKGMYSATYIPYDCKITKRKFK